MSTSSPEAYLESTAVRSMVTTMLEALCKSTPDRIHPFLFDHLRRAYPAGASQVDGLQTKADALGEYKLRPDVPPTTDSLQAYLDEICARPLLEDVLESVLHQQPASVVPFMMDRIYSLAFSAAVSEEPGADDEAVPARTEASPPVEAPTPAKEASVEASAPAVEASAEASTPVVEAAGEAPAPKEKASAPAEEAPNAAAESSAATDGEPPASAEEAPAAAEAAEAAAPAAEPATVPAAAGLLEEFFRAVNEGDAEAATAAIAKGVDLSTTDQEGRTALHLAAEGELELVDSLLAAGVPVDAPNGEGKTPLMLAIQYQDAEIVEKLLAAGASKDAVDSSGKSVTAYVEEQNYAAIVKLVTGAEVEQEEVKVDPNLMIRRSSVNSGSIDPTTLDLSQVPVFDKDDETKASIVACVADNILFKSLGEDTLNTVVMAMKERTVSTGEVVISQGDNGDYFFVVGAGSFDCFKMPADASADGAPEPPGELVMGYKDKGSFGELALMYDSPRAATVIATSDGLLWQMDRLTFRTVILTGALAQQDQLPGRS